MGVSRSVPGYIMREEFQWEKLSGKAGMRACKYEKRLKKGRGGVLARACWEEMKERAREGKTSGKWEKEREEFFERLGWTLERIEERREEEGMRGEEIVVKDKELQRKERWEKIRMGKCNKDYGKIKEEGVPEYLKKGWKEEKWQRVGRIKEVRKKCKRRQKSVKLIDEKGKEEEEKNKDKKML
ncbi:golgin subfamily A member 6-like protein 22 [Cardiocondyla obscurior]|uniref:golgin subfamily A member 6-like protein 22 n=1 Tax=Cardiocondyla obscurior TaxID=286306 RepID=UPI00396567A9